ncbi:hypothetical protein DVH24_015569 [Malus domestica]|uniref:ATPase F1/V1/A1 complex alpha/beta subunit nucleotide-binding domain-containing protein n=1 Tax=Malus domestica TaxID=3750 RepID=A0A498HNG1_MALDO|nr:hypothetical protein DVH24_015569 [Malus domestica]
MGDSLMIQEGSSRPVSEAFLGHVINALAKPIDGRGEISSFESQLIVYPAPSIILGHSVYEPFQTRLIVIDSMIPIGRGQRELIIMDKQTYKTVVTTDTILNHQRKNVICVYVVIGLKASSVAQVVTALQEMGTMEYTIVVTETANSPATLQYLAPYIEAALAEYLYIVNNTLRSFKQSLQTSAAVSTNVSSITNTTGPRSLSRRCFLFTFMRFGKSH